MNSETDRQKVRNELKRIKDNIRVTKIVSTRAIKGSRGDMFVGMSAGWDSCQEDGQQDMVHAGDESDAVRSQTSMTLRDAKIASHILALRVQITAFEQAVASGCMSVEEGKESIAAVTRNFASLTSQAVLGSS